MSVKVVCLCHDCIYNEKARCTSPGGIMIQHYALGPMCEDFNNIYDDIHEEAAN